MPKPAATAPPKNALGRAMARGAKGTPMAPAPAQEQGRKAAPGVAAWDAASLEEGVRRIAWARTHMQVLAAIRSRFEDEQPFAGLRIGMALHVEAKTANLALALAAGGADVRLAGCNPESTDDRVVAALNEHHGLATQAKKGQSKEEYYAALHWVLDHKPHFVIDDGGDLGFLAHTKRRECLEHLRGGAEETTTGVLRFKAMADEGKLAFPVLNVNDAQMKHLFDNRYGTGQSTFDGLFHATNLLVAGKDVVVAGYGWCGKGIAMRAKGLGATVTVTEVDPVKAIEARLDGHHVAPMEEACRTADFIVTATGCLDVVDGRHVPHLKDGVVLANAGHFNNEVSIAALEKSARSTATVRAGVTAYVQKDGRTLHLLSDGRLVNLASGQGHPVEIMDMSFSIQALGMEHLVRSCAAGPHEPRSTNPAIGKTPKEGKAASVVPSKATKPSASAPTLAPGVHEIPANIDLEVARLKLATLGVRIDQLTPSQKAYLSTWEHGT